MQRPGFRKSRQAPVLPRNVYRRGQEPGRAKPTRETFEPTCAIKSLCGTCKYVNLDYDASLSEKHLKGLAVLKEQGVLGSARQLSPARSPRAYEYRSLFKLAVRPVRQGRSILRPGKTDAAPNRFAIGLFEQGSHDVVDMDDCPLHTFPLRRLLRDLRAELNASTITPYDENAHTGQLRYVAARAAHLTGELMVTFVVTEPLKVELKRLIANLQRKGHKINSAHLNVNPEKGNAIFGPKTERIAGAEGLRERVCDLDFEIGPTSFFQINPWQAIQLYRRIEQIAGQASGNAVAWDLYCGTGQISLILARLGYKVLGIEENAKAVEDAGENARRNKLEDSSQFLASRVEDAQKLIPQWARDPELIVVNPSRRGLAETTRKHLRELLEKHPKARFIYVSCEVETLARDLKELTQSGFALRQIEPFDMFPQTDNMEWLAVLSGG